MTGPRMALPLPAWKTSGSPAKISLACSGRVNSTSGRPSGTSRTVNASPYLRCMAGHERCRKRISAALCTSAGQRGPGGSSRAVDPRARVPAERLHLGQPVVGEVILRILRVRRRSAHDP